MEKWKYRVSTESGELKKREDREAVEANVRMTVGESENQRVGVEESKRSL